MQDATDRISSIGSNGRVATAKEPSERPLHDLMTQLDALGEYAVHFILAKLDAAKVRVRHLILGMAMGIVALVMVFAISILCTTYVAAGISGGLAAWLDLPTWLAELLTGFLGLAVVAATIGLALRSSQKKSKKQKVNKYELRKAKQRAKFHRDTEETKREAA